MEFINYCELCNGQAEKLTNGLCPHCSAIEPKHEEYREYVRNCLNDDCFEITHLCNYEEWIALGK